MSARRRGMIGMRRYNARVRIRVLPWRVSTKRRVQVSGKTDGAYVDPVAMTCWARIEGMPAKGASAMPDMNRLKLYGSFVVVDPNAKAHARQTFAIRWMDALSDRTAGDVWVTDRDGLIWHCVGIELIPPRREWILACENVYSLRPDPERLKSLPKSFGNEVRP